MLKEIGRVRGRTMLNETTEGAMGWALVVIISIIRHYKKDTIIFSVYIFYKTELEDNA